MDCRDFENCLDLLEAGSLPPEKQQRAINHADSCVRCRTLLALARGEEVATAAETCDGMILAILERTTGAACTKAEERLCDYVDGHLGEDEEEILSLHLAHCSGCSSKADALRELKELLPSLAVIEPGGRFTAEVLRATSGRSARYPTDRTAMALRAWWLRMLRRPRFACEAAYAGALLVLITIGNPALLPAASTVPKVLLERSDRLFQEATSVITERQSAASHSFGNLQLMGEDLLEKAAAFQTRTTSALRQELASFFAQLKSGFLGEDTEDMPPRTTR